MTTVDDATIPELPILDPIQTWQQERTPEKLSAAVDYLNPKLAYHLHRYGLGDDKLAHGQARILAAKALQSYDPASGASLHTWLDRSMQPLSRFKRTRATAIKVPERIQLEAYRINRATLDFEEEHGREPEVDELAEYAGLSRKRLDQVQKSFRKMSGESAFEGNLPSELETDFMSEALDAVWDESDKRDRMILEHRIGFGGKELMQPKDLAVKMNISPVELSRRSARISAKLDEILEKLER